MPRVATRRGAREPARRQHLPQPASSACALPAHPSLPAAPAGRRQRQALPRLRRRGARARPAAATPGRAGSARGRQRRGVGGAPTRLPAPRRICRGTHMARVCCRGPRRRRAEAAEQRRQQRRAPTRRRGARRRCCRRRCVVAAAPRRARQLAGHVRPDPQATHARRAVEQAATCGPGRAASAAKRGGVERRCGARDREPREVDPCARQRDGCSRSGGSGGGAAARARV